jgi:NAD(P)-dependent dehydrogenase (short-subunit alcohol dehydrogenase family)
MTLKDQRTVVLGGTSGIGLATAKAARALGADAVVTGRDEGKLTAATDELGPGATAARVDATEREQLDRFFRDLGQLDHLVLAVGEAAGAGPIVSLDLADLRAGFERKFWPHLAALQAALAVTRPEGSITFISAASAGAPLPGTAGLAAINGALEAMIPALAAELKPLRINAVSPGVIDTPLWHGMPEAEREALFTQYASATPVGRIGSPEDVAQAVISLITNDFITGTVVTVDGGLTLSAAA